MPRPAMFVATVTAPLRPAWAMIAASLSWYLALSTWCGTPRLRSIVDSFSLFSTLTVPTRIGWPAAWRSAMSSTTASHLASSVRYTRSARSSRIIGRLVGIGTTPSL